MSSKMLTSLRQRSVRPSAKQDLGQARSSPLNLLEIVLAVLGIGAWIWCAAEVAGALPR